KPSQRQLSLIPEFCAYVIGDRHAKRKTLALVVQTTSSIAVHSRSTIYRTIDTVTEDLKGSYVDSIRVLPTYLRSLGAANPGSCTALKVDQDGRFYRAFGCLRALVQGLESCQRVLGFDGTHFRHTKYNGVLLTLLGRDGNNQIFSVAAAIVPIKSSANVRWFVDHCLKSHVPLCNGRPIFLRPRCDSECRGGLARGSSQQMNLRYCTIHILRNIKTEVGSGGKKLEDHVWGIQGAETRRIYEKKLELLRAEFGEPIANYVQAISPAR
ncbi:TPA: hypothetical protein N0F65_010706, partial [Lagenidium giganteum]